MKRNYGDYNKTTVFQAIKQYANDNPDVTIKIERSDCQFAVALVTPFIRRAHQNLREASEVVFVDATTCVDQLNTTIIPVLCAGPVGAVPLGVVFTSSQDEATLKKMFVISLLISQ